MTSPIFTIGLFGLLLVLAGLTWLLIRVPKRKSIQVGIIGLALLTGSALVLLIGQSVHEYHMIIQGRTLVVRLEGYRLSHGEYPIALSQIGVDETKVGIFYQRDYESPSVFYLWFGTGFGTVSQYDSQTRTWHGPR